MAEIYPKDKYLFIKMYNVAFLIKKSGTIHDYNVSREIATV